MDIYNFTDEQQEKLIKRFSEDFFNSILEKLNYYAHKWQLSDFSLIEYYSWNCLFTCKSEKYKDCVLKLFSGDKDIYMNEINVLKDQKRQFSICSSL